MYGKYAYVSNGFGILKLNMTDIEITDTYNLGFPVTGAKLKETPFMLTVLQRENIAHPCPATY